VEPTDSAGQRAEHIGPAPTAVAPADTAGPSAAAAAEPGGGRWALRRVLWTLLALAVAGYVISVVVQLRAKPSLAEDRAQPVTQYPAQERSAPVEMVGVALDGSPVDVSALRGGPAVLNVWGSWCGPCQQEAPILSRLSTEYADRGVRFLGIDVRDEVAAAQAFERKFQIPYPSIHDRGGRAVLVVSRYAPASVVPATLVLDRQGRVAARVLGAVEESTLRALLDEVLAET
jgi:thiol-disulfide isomerase/thioredoxin